MEPTTLEYLTTWGVQQFKDAHNINTLNIILNPHTNRHFFVSPENSEISGKVSTKDWQSDPVISLCKDKGNDQKFFMLHKRGDNSSNVVATL